MCFHGAVDSAAGPDARRVMTPVVAAKQKDLVTVYEQACCAYMPSDTLYEV